MSMNSRYREELLTDLKEREQREHIFNLLGMVSAAIIFIVFVIAKWQVK